MSQHNSLKSGGSATSKKRSVLKRFERIDLLRKRGAIKEITKARRISLRAVCFNILFAAAGTAWDFSFGAADKSMQ